MTGAVVHVVAAGEIGGAERMLVDLVRRGASAGRPHSIALFTPNDQLRALFRDEGLTVDDRGSVREDPVSFLRRALGSSDVAWLGEVLRRRRAQIVHLHTFASQVLGTRAAERAGARVVRTEHSTRVYDDPSCWPFSRWSLKRADAVVCISEHVRGVATARAPFLLHRDARLAVVHNGVDTARFVPPARGAEATPAARDEHVRFVAVGRLDPRKGLDLALEALARVPRARLDVIGDGSERRPLEALATQLGLGSRVHFAGFAGDVREAIAEADVALSSSRHEGLGIALLEAMAMERPVVAVPIGGLPEIVADGETGWLAGAREPAALARAMQAAVESGEERRRRGVSARLRVLHTFSLDAMCHGYEQVYSTLSR